LEQENKDESILAVWNVLLVDNSFWNTFKDGSHIVRSTVCSSISNISANVFTSLPEDLQKKCLQLSFTMTSDSSPLVRNAACRTVGVYAMFPTLHNDITFVTESIRILTSAFNDNNLNVRIRACWSLGNLCDALVKSSISPSDIPTTSFKRIADCCVKGTKDNDKVRSNAVRALGNLGRIAPASLLETDYVLERIVEALNLALNVGSVKVQWNSSYAVGNLFKNNFIQKKLDSVSWAPSLFKGLLSLVKNCKNFKARINAVLALSLLPMRSHYPGPSFIQIWETLIEALETLDEMTDFSEFKYQENLRLQLITSLSHIINLSTADDLNVLKDLLKLKAGPLSQLFEKHKQQAQDEIQEDISSALAKLVPFVNK